MKNQEFWRKIGSDLQTGPETYADKNNVPLNSVLAAAIAESFNENQFSEIEITENNDSRYFRYKSAPWMRRKNFWRLKRFFGLIFTVFIFAGWFVYSAAYYYDLKKTNRIVTARDGGIEPFQMVVKGDTVRQSALWNYGSADPPDLFNGRYVSAKKINKGDVLSEENLLSAELSSKMSGRLLTTVSTKTDFVSENFTPDKIISLTSAGKTNSGEESKLIDDVILLAIERKQNTVSLTIAVTPDQLKEIYKLPDRSELIIVYK